MKRVNPRSLFQARPQAAAICISIYANDKKALVYAVEEARLICLKDHGQGSVERAFNEIDRWLADGDHENAHYPVALFASTEFSGVTSLPAIARNLTVVANSFHVKPLLKWLQRDRSFLILKFEERRARLMQCGLSNLKNIDILEVAESEWSDESLKLAGRVANEVFAQLDVPVIVAGESGVVERFYQISGRKNVVPTPIIDQGDWESELALHKAALRVLEPYMERREDGLVKKYWRAFRSGQTTSSLNELVYLGVQGRIKHLFVSEKMNLWGQINYRTGEFKFTQRQHDSQDDCILDDLSEIVLFHGGSVTVLPTDRMPDNHAACGILKYPSIASRAQELARQTSELIKSNAQQVI